MKMGAAFALVALMVAVVVSGFGDDNKPAIDVSLIEKVNSNPSSTWKAGVNEMFKGMTRGEAKKMLGTYINTRPFIAGIPDVTSEVKDGTLPEYFDWRKQPMGKCIHEIRNQEQCGSCWAFGATEALSDRFCIDSKGSKLNPSQYPKGLSPEDLVSCDKQNYGCNGGYLQLAWQFMTNPGVVTDKCFPYGAGGGQAPPCRHSCENGQQWTPYKVAQGTVKHVVGVTAIQENLMKHGPQEVAFSVYEDFFSYKSGVYQHEYGGLDGGHAVKFVGWGVDDSQKGLPYWIVANSWGKGWADLGGFFWIRKGVDECGIESSVYAGTPDLHSGEQ